MSGLPMGWAETTLDECTLLNPKLDHPVPNDAQISFVPMLAVSDISGEIEGPQDRAFGEVSKGYTRFQTGDVIFAKITPCMENGKIAVARELTSKLGCGSTEFHVLRPLGGISADFIWRFLRQSSFRTDAERSMTGAVGQRRVPLDYLRAHTIPVPPLPEQRRIVAKIDSLSAKSRRARDHLDHIPRLVEKYKQAILAAAYTGRLRGAISTPLVETQIADLLQSGPQNGLYLPKSRYGRGTPILRIENYGLNEFDEVDRWQQVDIPRDVQSLYALKAGDLIINRVNSPSHLGKSLVVSDSMVDAVFESNMMRMHFRSIGHPRYIQLYLSSTIGRGRLIGRAKWAVNQASINQGDVTGTFVPMVSLGEQIEVVRRIETAFAWINRLASEATSARKLIDHLDQAVLAKAFRGELVPQDPNDEPASTLLERIGAARETPPHARRDTTGGTSQRPRRHIV